MRSRRRSPRRRAPEITGEYSQATLKAHFDATNKRLAAIEEQLKRLATPYKPSADKNVSKDATAKSGVTEGIEKNAPATGARATPTNVITAPVARVVQNTV